MTTAEEAVRWAQATAARLSDEYPEYEFEAGIVPGWVAYHKTGEVGFVQYLQNNVQVDNFRKMAALRRQAETPESKQAVQRMGYYFATGRHAGNRPFPEPMILAQRPPGKDHTPGIDYPFFADVTGNYLEDVWVYMAIYRRWVFHLLVQPRADGLIWYEVHGMILYPTAEWHTVSRPGGHGYLHSDTVQLVEDALGAIKKQVDKYWQSEASDAQRESQRTWEDNIRDIVARQGGDGG